MGRRRLTLYSLAGVTAALVLLGVGFFAAEVHSPSVQGSGTTCSVFRTCFDCVADEHCGYCPSDAVLPHGYPMAQCLEGNETAASGGSCVASKWAFSSCPNSSQAAGWFILVSLFVYLAAFAPGMGPMPWTVNSEIYPLHVRSRCVGLATSVNWICNLLVACTFLSITRTFTTYGAFWLYALFGFVGWVFLYSRMPETKGTRLEDIEQLFT